MTAFYSARGQIILVRIYCQHTQTYCTAPKEKFSPTTSNVVLGTYLRACPEVNCWASVRQCTKNETVLRTKGLFGDPNSLQLISTPDWNRRSDRSCMRAIASSEELAVMVASSFTEDLDDSTKSAHFRIAGYLSHSATKGGSA